MKHIICISAASGCGKSTIIDCVPKYTTARQARSLTTRQPRGPDDNRIFVSMEEFLKLKDTLLEFVLYDGHAYGVPKDSVETLLKTGPVLLDVNEFGARQILSSGMADKVSTILLVCSAQELYTRQVSRAGSFESKLSRLKSSIAEVESAMMSGLYQTVIKNGDDNYQEAVEKVIRIINGENVQSDEFDLARFKAEMTSIIQCLEYEVG